MNNKFVVMTHDGVAHIIAADDHAAYTKMIERGFKPASLAGSGDPDLRVTILDVANLVMRESGLPVKVNGKILSPEWGDYIALTPIYDRGRKRNGKTFHFPTGMPVNLN